MTGILSIKNKLRDFCRKQDEIVSPIFRFIWMLIIFVTIQKMFHYSDLGSKKEITVLLSVLTALLPDGFLFVMAGALIGLHAFSVSLEVGAVFVVMYIIMFCVYIRFFPKYAYAMFLVPVFYVLGIPYAAPIAVAVIAGLGGMVPAVMGVVLYFFAGSVSEISRLLATEDVENEIEAFKMLSDVIIHNKEMYVAMIIFAVTIAVTSVLAKFSYDYAIYIAIAGGTVINILSSIFAGYVMSNDVDMAKVVFGSLIGIIFAVIVRAGQGILDYQHTERVQFEDDDYFYYVKAVPKIDSEKKNKKAASKEDSKEVRKTKKTKSSESRKERPRKDQQYDEQPAAMQYDEQPSRREYTQEYVQPQEYAHPQYDDLQTDQLKKILSEEE